MQRIVYQNGYHPERTGRIVDYCLPGKNILIQIDHGLGDVLMIYPHYLQLKEKFPDVRIDLKVIPCFRSLLPPIEPDEFYDYVFWIQAYFNERTPQLQNKTKPQCTVELDFGLPYEPLLDYSAHPKCRCNLVGFNFRSSNWLWKTVQCPYNTAKMLWERTEDAGFCCVDLFYPKDAFAARGENKKYDFIDWSLQDKKNVTIQKMFDLTNTCAGVASIATGTFILAMMLSKETTLFLKNGFDCCNYSREYRALTLDVNKPDCGVVDEWLRRIRNYVC